MCYDDTHFRCEHLTFIMRRPFANTDNYILGCYFSFFLLFWMDVAATSQPAGLCYSWLALLYHYSSLVPLLLPLSCRPVLGATFDLLVHCD